jgi:hypothetical protein
VLLPPLLAPQSAELTAPFVVEAGGHPIDAHGGNSAPAWADLDGDGLAELLVGEFEGGRVRIYRNVGARGAPRFEGFVHARAGGEFLSVPFG